MAHLLVIILGDTDVQGVGGGLLAGLPFCTPDVVHVGPSTAGALDLHALD